MSEQEQRNELKGKTGLRRVYNAMFYSYYGLKAAWKDEDAFRTMVKLAIILIPAGLYLGETWVEKMMLAAPLFISLMVELLNSSIENCADCITLEKNEYIKKAKDMGSAAQFVVLVFIGLVWGSWLICRFF